MNLRTDQKKQTRERIVAAAVRAIRSQGLEAPSVGGVMADAGLTVGGFYAHFPNRDALMLEAFGAALGERLAELEAAVPANRPDERRAVTARYYLSRKHRDGELAACPLPAILGEIARLDAPYRARLAEFLELWTKALQGDDAQGRERALAAMATMVGAFTLARALGNTPFSDELLRVARVAVAPELAASKPQER